MERCFKSEQVSQRGELVTTECIQGCNSITRLKIKACFITCMLEYVYTCTWIYGSFDCLNSLTVSKQGMVLLMKRIIAVRQMNCLNQTTTVFAGTVSHQSHQKNILHQNRVAMKVM